MLFFVTLNCTLKNYMSMAIIVIFYEIRKYSILYHICIINHDNCYLNLFSYDDYYILLKYLQ